MPGNPIKNIPPSPPPSATASPPAAQRTPVATPDATRLGRGLAALRIFVGVIFLANGLAKFLGIAQIKIGPYKANLIDRSAVKVILESEGKKAELPLVGRFINNVLLPNVGALGWLIAIFEVGVGLLLVLGLISRGAALLALFHGLGLAVLYFSSDRWLFEQPFDYVPAAILALVPSGLVWGLDGRLPIERARQGRWPF